MKKADLQKTYDDHASSLWKNFTYSLQQVPCNASPYNRYSLAVNCSNCSQAYKDWLCSVTIPAARTILAATLSCEFGTPGKTSSTALHSTRNMQTASPIYRINHVTRLSMSKSNRGHTRKSSRVKMFAIIWCGVARHLSSSVARRVGNSTLPTAEGVAILWRAITWELHIT